jgi:hypothetical protein
MGSSWGRRATSTLSRAPRSACILIWALALAGCNPDGQTLSPAQPRGATVAFDSLDGLPPGQFQKLVQNLNEEAQARRLAVISREQSSAYPGDRRLMLAKGRPRDAWAAADDAMLGRIARSSIEQLAAFLTSPAVAPGTLPTSDPQVAMADMQESSPEAAGIFRLFHPLADPAQTVAAEAATDDAEPVPRPPRRPRSAAVSGREALTLAASSR